MKLYKFEAIKIGFFRVMGQLLSETNKSFLSSETIELFAELKNCLNDPKLTEEVIVEFSIILNTKDVYWIIVEN